MGDFTLKSSRSRNAARIHVKPNVRRPQVAYRETIRKQPLDEGLYPHQARPAVRGHTARNGIAHPMRAAPP